MHSAVRSTLPPAAVYLSHCEADSRLSARHGRIFKKQKPFGPRREMEYSEDAFLHFAIEGDEQVAADYQIKLGKRRVAENVMLCEQYHLAQLFLDVIAATLLGKEAPQALR